MRARYLYVYLYVHLYVYLIIPSPFFYLLLPTPCQPLIFLSSPFSLCPCLTLRIRCVNPPLALFPSSPRLSPALSDPRRILLRDNLRKPRLSSRKFLELRAQSAALLSPPPPSPQAEKKSKLTNDKAHSNHSLFLVSAFGCLFSVDC
jgi:hypothetical protein